MMYIRPRSPPFTMRRSPAHAPPGKPNSIALSAFFDKEALKPPVPSTRGNRQWRFPHRHCRRGLERGPIAQQHRDHLVVGDRQICFTIAIKSPGAMARALTSSISLGAANVPFPLPAKTASVPEVLLPATKSSFPSPLRSRTDSASVPVPPVSTVAGVPKLPPPVPNRIVTLLGIPSPLKSATAIQTGLLAMCSEDPPPANVPGTPAANDATRDAHAHQYTRPPASSATIGHRSTNARGRAGASQRKVAMSHRCEKDMFNLGAESRGPHRTAEDWAVGGIRLTEARHTSRQHFKPARPRRTARPGTRMLVDDLPVDGEGTTSGTLARHPQAVRNDRRPQVPAPRSSGCTRGRRHRRDDAPFYGTNI
jgi:hypothetical protein